MISRHELVTTSLPRSASALPAWNTVPGCRNEENACASWLSTERAKARSRRQTAHSSALAGRRFAASGSGLASIASTVCACADSPPQMKAAVANHDLTINSERSRSRQAEVLDHPHARLAPAVVAGQQLRLGIAVMAVERAGGAVAGARLERDPADAGDLGRALEPREHLAGDAAAPM